MQLIYVHHRNPQHPLLDLKSQWIVFFVLLKGQFTIKISLSIQLSTSFSNTHKLFQHTTTAHYMLRLKSNHSGIFVTSLLFTAMRLGEDMKMPHNDSSTFVHPSFHQSVCGNSVCALILDDFSIAAPAYSGLSSFLNPIITIIYKTNSRKVFAVIRVQLELSSPACH